MKTSIMKLEVPSKKLLLMNNYCVNEFLEESNNGHNPVFDFEDGICISTETTSVVVTSKIREYSDGNYVYKEGEFNELEIRYKEKTSNEETLRKEFVSKLYLEGGQMIVVDLEATINVNLNKEFRLDSILSLKKDSNTFGYVSNLEDGYYYIYNCYDKNDELVKTII